MPKVLDDCVKKLMKKGYGKSSAFAICSESTGWKKGKRGKWVYKPSNKKRGKK